MTRTLDDAASMNRTNTAAFLVEAQAIPAGRWGQPRAEGKWSPAQVTEHVALSYEVGTRILNGESNVPGGPPKFLHPVVRLAIRLTILRTGKFPKGKSPKAFVPSDAAATQADLLTRLQSASESFEQRASAMQKNGTTTFEHPFFGRFGVIDYLRLVGFHIAHHQKQLGEVRT